MEPALYLITPYTEETMWPAEGYSTAPTIIQAVNATALEIQMGWTDYTLLINAGGQEILPRAFRHVPAMTEYSAEARLITLRQLAWAKVEIAVPLVFK